MTPCYKPSAESRGMGGSARDTAIPLRIVLSCSCGFHRIHGGHDQHNVRLVQHPGRSPFHICKESLRGGREEEGKYHTCPWEGIRLPKFRPFVHF